MFAVDLPLSFQDATVPIAMLGGVSKVTAVHRDASQPLELRLRQANLGQGLGFKCANIVIDKKLLKNVGFNLVAIGSTGAKNACIGSTAPFHTRSRNDQFTKTGSGQT